MVKKTQQPGDDKQTGAQFADTVKESAQQIWLAGLGAFAKAQEEGSKVFDSLVKEGTSMQRKTQAAAGEKIAETTSKMATMASDISSKASGQWGKLENIFEERVSKAVHKLGVPAAADIDALAARVDELERKLARLNPKTTSTARASASRAAKPAAKRAAPRKSL